MTTHARKSIAILIAACGHALATGLLLRPASPNGYTIAGQVYLAAILAMLTAAPLVLGLKLAERVPHRFGRGAAMLLFALVELVGVFYLVGQGHDADSRTEEFVFLERILTPQLWRMYFGESGALYQFPALLVGEAALIVLAALLWPWAGRTKSHVATLGARSATIHASSSTLRQ